MRIILPLFSLFLFVSCGQSPTNNLPGSSGRMGEVLIVVDNALWDAEVGEALRSELARQITTLPKPEPSFDLVNVPVRSFNRALRSHRNIVYPMVADSVVKPIVEFKKNVWARDQLVVEARAKDNEALMNLLSRKGSLIIGYFNQREVGRLIKRNKNSTTKEINTVLGKHHLSIVSQKGFSIATDTNDFVWLRLERERPLGGYQHQISQGILLYHQPYMDTASFGYDKIIQNNDSITKKYVPGGTKGSYMITSNRHGAPQENEITLYGNYAKIVRGVWRIENGYMAGPFISLTTVDPARNRLLTAIGYVYAPQFDKREFLREVEAIIKSIRFEDAK